MVIFQFEFEYFRHLSIFIHLKMKMLRLSKVLIHLKMKMLRLSNVLIHLKMKMLRPGKAKDVFIHFRRGSDDAAFLSPGSTRGPQLGQTLATERHTPGGAPALPFCTTNPAGGARSRARTRSSR